MVKHAQELGRVVVVLHKVEQFHVQLLPQRADPVRTLETLGILPSREFRNSNVFQLFVIILLHTTVNDIAAATREELGKLNPLLTRLLQYLPKRRLYSSSGLRLAKEFLTLGYPAIATMMISREEGSLGVVVKSMQKITKVWKTLLQEPDRSPWTANRKNFNADAINRSDHTCDRLCRRRERCDRCRAMFAGQPLALLPAEDDYISPRERTCRHLGL